MKPKFNLEDYKGKKYAMHCPEKWQAEAYKKFIDKRNLRCDDSFVSPYSRGWDRYAENTCYSLETGLYESKGFYTSKDGYTILEFSDFDWSDMLKPLKRDISFGIPVHDLVYRPANVELTQPTHDSVNHPSHYTDGKIEVIDFIEDKKLGFSKGNAVKYICRAGKKDPNKEIEDLEKAIWYIQREIKMLGGVE